MQRVQAAVFIYFSKYSRDPVEIIPVRTYLRELPRRTLQLITEGEQTIQYKDNKFKVLFDWFCTHFSRCFGVWLLLGTASYAA